MRLQDIHEVNSDTGDQSKAVGFVLFRRFCLGLLHRAWQMNSFIVFMDMNQLTAVFVGKAMPGNYNILQKRLSFNP